MKHVTRNIDLDCVRDLLEQVPRACLSFASDHGPQVHPVRLLWQEDRYLVNMPRDEYQPVSDQEAVLLVDEGIYYFDLRAIYIRGRVRPVEAPSGTLADRTWFEIIPLKIVAWDYGMLREVENGS